MPQRETDRPHVERARCVMRKIAFLLPHWYPEKIRFDFVSSAAWSLDSIPAGNTRLRLHWEHEILNNYSAQDLFLQAQTLPSAFKHAKTPNILHLHSLREKPSLHLDLSCRSTHPLPVYDQTQHPHTQKTTSVRLGAEICQGRLGKQKDGSKFVPDLKYRNNERLLRPAKVNHFFLTL